MYKDNLDLSEQIYWAVALSSGVVTLGSLADVLKVSMDVLEEEIDSDSRFMLDDSTENRSTWTVTIA